MLKIRSASKGDFGSYKCVAKNSLGETDGVIKLDGKLSIFFFVQQPPEVQGLLIQEVSRSHTTTHHIWQDTSGRVIISSQRPLPDNTQHSQQTSLYPVGFAPAISAGEWPQTYALDRAASVGYLSHPLSKWQSKDSDPIRNVLNNLH